MSYGLDDSGFESQLWGPHPFYLAVAGVLFPGREADLHLRLASMELYRYALVAFMAGTGKAIIIIIIIIIRLSQLHSSAVFEHTKCTPD
jgi:hypothetical protein